jgi:hypothetical protein
MSKGCARSSKKGCGGRAAGRAVRIDERRCVDHAPVNICIQFHCEIWFNLEPVTVVWIEWPGACELAVRQWRRRNQEETNNRSFHFGIVIRARVYTPPQALVASSAPLKLSFLRETRPDSKRDSIRDSNREPPPVHLIN